MNIREFLDEVRGQGLAGIVVTNYINGWLEDRCNEVEIEIFMATKATFQTTALVDQTVRGLKNSAISAQEAERLLRFVHGLGLPVRA